MTGLSSSSGSDNEKKQGISLTIDLFETAINKAESEFDNVNTSTVNVLTSKGKGTAKNGTSKVVYHSSCHATKIYS